MQIDYFYLTISIARGVAWGGLILGLFTLAYRMRIEVMKRDEIDGPLHWSYAKFMVAGMILSWSLVDPYLLRGLLD